MKIHHITKAVLAAATFGLMTMGLAQAEQCPLVPDDKATMEGSNNADLLYDGKFAQLEANLEKQHRKNMSSDGEDLLTLRNVMELMQLSGRNEKLINIWAKERPQSFFSQFTAGTFYADQAAGVQGGRPMSTISKNDINRMNKLEETAIGYLQKAMQLDPRSALPQSVLIGIATLQGQAIGKNTAQWLQAANQVDPKNMATRANAIGFLSPRWGGSFDQIDQMVQQAQKSLSKQSAYYLAYNVVLQKASHEEVITGNKSKAYALYKQAKSMCENSSTAQAGIIRTYQ